MIKEVAEEIRKELDEFAERYPLGLPGIPELPPKIIGSLFLSAWPETLHVNDSLSLKSNYNLKMEKTTTKGQKVTLDLTKLTASELKELMEAAKRNENRLLNERKDAYEGIRAEVVHRIISKVEAVTSDVECLHTYVSEETEAFKDVMDEYGKLRAGGQMSFTLQDGNYKVEVKSNKVKKFDERADIASARLIEFLQGWIEKADNGTDNPMYQLAMVLLDRNKEGDLDYKNISKLYQLESKFNDSEYSAIMELFKESHLVEGNATRFYFSKKDKNGVWRKIEPSFNRL